MSITSMVHHTVAYPLSAGRNQRHNHCRPGSLQSCECCSTGARV